ncbi:MAG: hypothetical protein ABJB03_00575 [Rhodoglobus sp.]
MPDWVTPIITTILAAAGTGGVVGVFGYLLTKRSQERKRGDVVQGQVFALVNHVHALNAQIIMLGHEPIPVPDIFPKE